MYLKINYKLLHCQHSANNIWKYCEKDALIIHQPSFLMVSRMQTDDYIDFMMIIN